MAISKARAHKRAVVASLSRCVATGERQPDDPELEQARRDLKALGLQEYIEKVVAEAPPLSSEQRERISALLRTGGAA